MMAIVLGRTVPREEVADPDEQQCGPSGQRIRSDIFDGEIYLTDSFVIGFNIQ